MSAITDYFMIKYHLQLSFFYNNLQLDNNF